MNYHPIKKTHAMLALERHAEEELRRRTLSKYEEQKRHREKMRQRILQTQKENERYGLQRAKEEKQKWDHYRSEVGGIQIGYNVNPYYNSFSRMGEYDNLFYTKYYYDSDRSN